MTNFAIVAIPPQRLTLMRQRGADDYGNQLVPTTKAAGLPLRCCLRRAEVGERVAVICYSPWTEPSPWLEAGPVFVHIDHCAGYTAPTEYPPQFAESPSMFNPFLADGSRDYEHIRFVEPGENHTAALREVLAHPEVHHLHVRSSVAGCFTFAVNRWPTP